jgi:magnesium transporter
MVLANNNRKRIFKQFHRPAHADLPVETLISKPLNGGTTTINILALNAQELITTEINDINELSQYPSTNYPIIWVQVIGIGDWLKLEAIANYFNIHRLAMEDIINLSQRPKIEEYEEFILAVTRVPKWLNGEVELEQLSLLWGKNFIISFMENHEHDYLAPLYHRLHNETKRQQFSKPEYISYAIIDLIIDSFFPLLENYGQRLDDIEDDAITNPSSQIIVNIHGYKHDLLSVRRVMWSQREALRKLVEITKFDDKDLRFFVRDCEDHTMQIIDILESYRERTGGLMDIYLSSVNNKMNEIMKVLTMISVIFMPAGVVASIYGMNFDRSSKWNLPELSWKYGYEYALTLMFLMAIIFIFYFKRKGWILKKKN